VLIFRSRFIQNSAEKMMYSCTLPKTIYAAIVSLLVLLSTLVLLVKLDTFDKDGIVANSNLFSHLRKLQTLTDYADNLPTNDEVKSMGLLSRDIYYVNDEAPVLADVLPENYVANEEDWINIQSTEAMIVRSNHSDRPNHLVVAFRGTAGSDDIITDMNMVLTPIDIGDDVPDDVYIHEGFREALMEDGIIEEIEGKVLNSLNDQSLNLSNEIYVTGHSLGGALAQLFGAYWAHKYPGNRVKLISFGQPRVGVSEFKTWAEDLTNFNQIRIVYRNDPVPRRPYRAVGYRHSGHIIQIEDEGVTAYYRQNGNDDTYDGVPTGWNFRKCE
jgi:hypothetical protein